MKAKLLKASPHGPVEQIFDNIWFVRGGVKMPMLMPMKISRAMTIVRGDNGELTLLNSMRLSDAGLRELDALGKVTNVIRVAGFHGRDDAFYREKYGATIYAIEGQRYIRGMDFKVGADKDYMQADVYLDETSETPLPGARIKMFRTSSPPEAVLLLPQEGGILIAGDSLQHTPVADEYFNLPAKFMMGKFGFFKPFNVGPGWLKFASPGRADIKALLNLDFEHVIPGHGTPVKGGAKEKYRPTIEGELKGCREAQ